MRKLLFACIILSGCFTYQIAKNLTDSQTLYRDVSILTAGKLGGEPWIPSRYGAIRADLRALEEDYAKDNPLSLMQVHDFERSLAIFRLRDSIGASPKFWSENAPVLDTAAYEIFTGESKKNSK